MPTIQVTPESHEALQDIANGLLKARKVVVVTGAGISTNSGIPDFRSENGLYSLIQAQFDTATRRERRETGEDADSESQEPSTKRRRISRESSAEREDDKSSIIRHGSQRLAARIKDEMASEEQLLKTPSRVPGPVADCIQVNTSPLSSPPLEELIAPPSGFCRTRSRLAGLAVAPSSSPLSSPPPVLFDPFQDTEEDETGGPRSTSPSEVEEDSPTPTNPFSSQGSGRAALPNMKGKDLFDASIWSDPLRTSVFYTFATTLRQKVKDVEPTSSHRFISHLRDRGKLVRCYTQNIDQIEEKVGLSTSLEDGPGSRGRFSRKSTASNQLAKMVEEVSACKNEENNATDKPESTPDEASSQCAEANKTDSDPAASSKLGRKEVRSGVECVFLHGSLEQLRCFLCGRVCPWDEREMETMSGQQPECPHCVGATTAREEKGKRALGIGKLRPDIVLYGEEHPNAHLISPIVTHDLGLGPDMLLILGTSLRVHGLKVLVKEFAKAVHSKGGSVVFINFTKPPESYWGDMIDYWIQWDCDAWVADLQTKVPKLWQAPEPPKPRKKPGSGEEGDKSDIKKPPPAHPVALRDTKAVGAYWTLRIVKNLHKMTGHQPPERPESMAPTISVSTEPSPSAHSTASATTSAPTPIQSTTPIPIPQPPVASARAKAKRPRKSAPGALEKPPKPPSTLNPNHGRALRAPATPSTTQPAPIEVVTPIPIKVEVSSILDSVKSNPRVRKRKKIFGEEVVMPSVGTRRAVNQSSQVKELESQVELTLPPLKPQPHSPTTSPYGRPRPIEITSPPTGPPGGPLAPISANLKSTLACVDNAFYIQDPLIKHLEHAPSWWTSHHSEMSFVVKRGEREDEADAALVLAGLRDSSSPQMMRSTAAATTSVVGDVQADLTSWGRKWKQGKG